MNRELKKQRAAVLAAVRDFKDTESVRLVLNLLRLRIEALMEDLVTADVARAPMLQGAIIELRDLETGITAKPKDKQDKDGAYA